MGRRMGKRRVLDQGRLLMLMEASPVKELGKWRSGWELQAWGGEWGEKGFTVKCYGKVKD